MPVVLEEALAGEEVASPQGGKAWLLRRSAEGLVNEAGAIRKRLLKRFAPGTKVHRRLAEFAGREDLLLQDLLFLDIETCGLSNAPLLLDRDVGM